MGLLSSHEEDLIFEEEACAFVDVDDSGESSADRFYDHLDEIRGSESMAQHSHYWDSQAALLQEIIERYGSTSSKFREEIIRIVTEARTTNRCSCPNRRSNGCISCLRRRSVSLLCDGGFRASLCTSRWNHTKKFPGGIPSFLYVFWEYIEVAVKTQGRKMQVVVVIELELREHFEIAKACRQYLRLVNQLPEMFVGKPECLNAIVGVLCDAAKKSMKDRNIHMGPWRKKSFVQMKWSKPSSTLSCSSGVPVA